MSRKAKYTTEQKIKACEEYLLGTRSAIQIAKKLNMGKHGDIVLTFIAGNIVPHDIETESILQKVIHENKIDIVFRATIEATRNAILSTLRHAKTTVGREDNTRYNIKEVK